jgi:putative endopeptidase
MRLATFLATLLAVVPISASAQDDAGQRETAKSAKTFDPWGIDLGARDLAVKPGNDFANYASGTWAAKTVIPADQPETGAFYDLYDLSQAQLRSLVEGAPAGTQIAALYKSFMDEARLEALDAKPLAPDLAAIAAVSDKIAFARLAGVQAWGFGQAMFDLGVYADPNRPGINALMLNQDGLGLPDRDYYLTPGFKPQLAAYRAYVERALRMIGYRDPVANADAIVAFETDVAKVSWAAADRRDVEKTNNPMTLAQLESFASDFPWQPYLEGAEIADPGASILVQEKSAIKAIAEVYARTPLPTLKAWSSFHVVYAASKYLSKRFVDSRFEFDRTISGVESQRPRWKRGVTQVDGSLGELVGQTYVATYFTPASKAEMVKLVGYVKAAMGDRITGASWMSPSTKKEALTKLAAMQVMVGYPEKWRDYSKLRIDPGDLFGNVERSNEFEWRYALSDLAKPVDPKKWGMTPQTVNAYNGEFENKIVFPAGILQPPFFNAHADPAVNYGGIGAVIGHEISHGFDDQGRKIDASGRLRDWWTADDAARFVKQTAVYGKQYDDFAPLPGVHVNGSLTMGENIADLAGLLVAYDAYHRSLQGKPAPVIDGLTGDQRFFLAWAQVWRGKQREDSLREQVTTDPHSPVHFRALGPLRDIDAWYTAFDVKPGDHYYVAPSARARIW